MAKKLYVGNLPYTTTEDELSTLFGGVGSVVEATVIYDRETGRSKGFGFVEMEDEESAASCMEKLNGTEVGGRTLKVAEARPRRESRDTRYGW